MPLQSHLTEQWKRRSLGRSSLSSATRFLNCLIQSMCANKIHNLKHRFANVVHVEFYRHHVLLVNDTVKCPKVWKTMITLA